MFSVRASFALVRTAFALGIRLPRQIGHSPIHLAKQRSFQTLISFPDCQNQVTARLHAYRGALHAWDAGFRQTKSKTLVATHYGFSIHPRSLF